MASSLISRAKEILAKPDHKNAAALISQINHPTDNQIRESSFSLYRFCSENFPNSLTLMLLKVYRCSIEDHKLRARSLALLESHLDYLSRADILLVPEAFKDIQSGVLSCVHTQEITDSEFKILSRIISRIVLDILLENHIWVDLCDVIATFADQDIKRAFYIFNSLPLVLDCELIMLIAKKIFPQSLKSCLNSESYGTQDWFLALETSFTMAVHLASSRRRDLSGNISYAILKSLQELVKSGKEASVRMGLQRLREKVEKEGERFRSREYAFVSSLASKIVNLKGVGEDTKKAVKRINWILSQKCLDFGMIVDAHERG